MSAFVVPAEHVSELAKAMVEFSGTDIEPAAVAGILMRENIRSVCHRYRDDKPSEYQGELEAAVMLADEPRAVTDPVVLLKMTSCLRYQSCECDDFAKSKAARMLDAFEKALEPRLPRRTERAYLPDGPMLPEGYDDAMGWPYDPRAE